MSTTMTQVTAIARRSVMRTSRQPASIIPPLIFPVVLMLVNAGGLRRSTDLPGFPTASFLAFALAVPFIQGALFSTMNAGTDIARDVQTGFVNRLSLTALRDFPLLLGQLAGILVLGIVQVVFYIVVGLTAGVHFESGPAGSQSFSCTGRSSRSPSARSARSSPIAPVPGRPSRPSSRSCSCSCSSRR